MSNYASNTKLGELSLVGDAPASPSAPPSPGPAFARTAAGTLTLQGSDASPGSQDQYMAEAVREFESGKIEQPLWVRSMAQANGDVKTAKPAYLRARAVALKLERRMRRAEVPTRGGGGGARAPSQTSPTWQRPARLDGKRIGIAASGLALVVAIVLFFVVRPGNDSPDASSTGAVLATTRIPSPPQRVATKPDASPGGALSGEDFASKIQAFKDAGNWNLIVLYAVEWTRKEPANAQAWKELGGGYLRMRQYDDALEATRKAVQMLPNDAQLWQNLGQINVALYQPATALTAFQKASELNEHDVTSRVQAGAINVELGHLPDARAAYASALAINPNDLDALCGSATVARKEGRTKDVDAIVRSAKAAGLECREPEPPPLPVAASPAPTKKPATQRSR